MKLTQSIVQLLFWFYCDRINCQYAQFQQFLDHDDIDAPNMFHPIDPMMPLGSHIECAALALTRLNRPEPSSRSSAFKFKDGDCTTGFGLEYIDALIARPRPMGPSKNGIYFLSTKTRLSAAENVGMIFNVILNEELDFHYGYHVFYPRFPGFSRPPNSAFVFTIPSPVQTFNGRFGMDFVNGPNYIYQLPMVYLKDFSIFTWYNSGPNPPENDCIVRLVATNTSIHTNSIPNWISIIELFVAEYDVYEFSPGPQAAIELFDRDKDFLFPYRMSTSMPNAIPTNQWVYIGVIVDQTNQQISFYINGTLLNSQPLVHSPPLPVILDYGEINMLEIGRNVYNMPLNSHLGSLSIFNHALTSAEVSHEFERSFLDG